MAKYWSLISAALGLAVIVAAVADAIVIANWFDGHAIPEGPSPVPELVIAFLGLVLLVGGLASAIRGQLSKEE